MKKDWQKGIKILKEGGIAIIPTDTLYGMVASAFDKKAIEKIYKIKNREKDKPLIVLISSVRQLKDFNIKGDFTKIFQPKVSILLECKNHKFKYIHRGTGEIAFRLISKRNKNLYNFLEKVGPIVAPSANRESEKPAETIREAKEYFGNQVDYYLDGSRKIGEPSTLIRLKDGNIEILRQGVVKIK
jgi:L-threonylcarbamoyladenylate synthase